MTKAKLSVTLDPEKLNTARELIGTRTVSETLAASLDRLIEIELDRLHVQGYRRHAPPPGDDAWTELERDPTDYADDTDWAELYGLASAP